MSQTAKSVPTPYPVKSSFCAGFSFVAILSECSAIKLKCEKIEDCEQSTINKPITTMDKEHAGEISPSNKKNTALIFWFD